MRSRLTRQTLVGPPILFATTCVVLVGLTGCGAAHVAPATPPAAGGAPPPGATLAGSASTPDIARYCQLSDQLAELEDRVSDPATFARQAASQLSEISRVAPGQIRAAIGIYVDDTRAAGKVPGTTAPEAAAVTQAESTLDAFENENCH